MAEIKVLSLETVTRRGSLAVLSGEIVCGTYEGDEKSSHSPELVPNIKILLEQIEINLREIELIAVANGPGSFTGLRIGLATAKALSSALQIPAIGVSLLEAAVAAKQENNSSKVNCVVFPAGRGEVFAQNFILDENGCQISLGEVERIELKTLLSKILENKSQLVAPLELWNEILSLAYENKNKIVGFPQNIAAAIGKIAVGRYEQITKSGELAAFYL